MKDVPYFAQAFGQILRARREEAGLTQQKLADRIEGVRSYIQFLEYGKQTPAATTVIVLAEALGMEPAELFADAVMRMERLKEMSSPGF